MRCFKYRAKNTQKTIKWQQLQDELLFIAALHCKLSLQISKWFLITSEINSTEAFLDLTLRTSHKLQIQSTFTTKTWAKFFEVKTCSVCSVLSTFYGPVTATSSVARYKLLFLMYRTAYCTYFHPWSDTTIGRQPNVFSLFSLRTWVCLDERIIPPFQWAISIYLPFKRLKLSRLTGISHKSNMKTINEWLGTEPAESCEIWGSLVLSTVLFWALFL